MTERESEREREREREYLPDTGLSLQMATTGWTRPKSGAWHSILVSHVSGSDPNTWTFFCCLPKCISGELVGKWSSQDWNLRFDMGCQHCGWRLTPPHGTTSPLRGLLMSPMCCWGGLLGGDAGPCDKKGSMGAKVMWHGRGKCF